MDIFVRLVNAQTLTNAFYSYCSPVCKIWTDYLHVVFLPLHHKTQFVMHGHPLPRLNLKLWIIYQRASRSIIIYLCKSVIIRNSIAEASRYCNCYHKIFICFTSNIFISYTVLQRFVQQQICILLKGSRGFPRDGPVIQWKIDAGKRWERCWDLFSIDDWYHIIHLK